MLSRAFHPAGCTAFQGFLQSSPSCFVSLVSTGSHEQCWLCWSWEAISCACCSEKDVSTQSNPSCPEGWWASPTNVLEFPVQRETIPQPWVSAGWRMRASSGKCGELAVIPLGPWPPALSVGQTSKGCSMCPEHPKDDVGLPRLHQDFFFNVIMKPGVC